MSAIAPQSPLRILVVDDDPISRVILTDHLSASGHDVFFAESAAAAMYLLEHSPAIHIVVADWVMPEISGLDLCRWVRGRTLPRSPHFVMLTAHDSPERLVEAFEAGVDDFLSKPFREAELLARLRAWTRLVSLQDELARRHQESSRLATDLIAANKTLSDLATRDDLTGLGNRREAMRRLDEQFHLAVHGGGRSLTCASIDVDKFKRFNDSHGHAAGDEVLKQVASAIREAAPVLNLCFRMGGDEFLILLPHQRLAETSPFTDRLRAAIARRPLMRNGFAHQVSISVGLAESDPAMTAPDHLLDRADAALYTAKRAGRNAVRRSA